MILSTHGIVGSQITQFVGLLDLYPSAAAAYSLRKLRSAYTGSAIEVRRTNLDVADIGFTSTGALDTAALLAFTGTGALDNGFVTKWYDQSGNARNATQATALNQPQIVSAGSVVIENGNPTMRFDGINDVLQSASFTTISQPLSVFAVNKYITINNAAGAGAPFTFDLGTDRSLQLVTAPNKYYGYFGDYIISTIGANFSNYQLSYMMAKGITSQLKVENETVITGNLGTLGASRITISGRGSANYNSNQFFSEFIFYPVDQSSNRTGIETNINNFYSI